MGQEPDDIVEGLVVNDAHHSLIDLTKRTMPREKRDA